MREYAMACEDKNVDVKYSQACCLLAPQTVTSYHLFQTSTH